LRWTRLTDCRRLLNWSRLTPVIEFYGMLMRHLDGVVAWARHRMANSRVRAISQRAHGYRDPNNLMLVLYHASRR
jgi:hypothetical protein